MPKRKHDDPDGAGEKRRNKWQKQNVSHKLAQGTKSMAHAFKVGRNFEVQKLARRKKKAAEENNEKDVERFDAEIEAIKALDLTVSAQHKLCKALLKTKGVKSHPLVPPEIMSPTPLPTATASLNGNSRLCKTKPVREAQERAIADVLRALRMKVDTPALAKKQKSRAEDVGVDPSDGQLALAKWKPEQEQQGVGRLQADVDHERNPRSQEDEDEEEAYDALKGRIASDEESEAEISDVEALERRLASEGMQRKPANPTPDKYDFEADLSISGSDAGLNSPSPEPQKAPQPPKKSSFLPSLTLSGYISGSDSEVDREIEQPVRKNRRGQRARQQIWEQKYGAKANHLKKQAVGGAGWDPKRGAVEGGAPRWKGGRVAAGSREPGRYRDDRDVARAPQGQRKEAEEKPLHPSWQAAKLAKARTEVPAVFQGKKISFD